MKLAVVAFLASLVPVSAFAVRTNDCPESIKVRFGNVSALTVRQIIDGTQERLEMEYDGEKVGKIRDALFNVRSWEKTLKLVAPAIGANGRRPSAEYCIYLPEGQTRAYGDNETRLQRKSSRDMLRISIDLGIQAQHLRPPLKETVWVYVNLSDYKATGVTIVPTRGAKVMGWHDHGSPIHHFGWVNDIEVK